MGGVIHDPAVEQVLSGVVVNIAITGTGHGWTAVLRKYGPAIVHAAYSWGGAALRREVLKTDDLDARVYFWVGGIFVTVLV